jgi:hypothetical protein
MPQKIMTQTSIGTTGGASPVNARFAGGYTTSHDFYVRNVWEEMMRIEPYQTPLVNLLFLSKAVKWRETANLMGLFEFPEKEMLPNMTTFKVNSGGAGGTTITINPVEDNLFITGKSVKFLDTGETGYVSDATSGAVVVTKDWTNAGVAQNWTSTPADDTVVMLLGEAHSENDATPDYVYTEPYMRKNRVQLFEKSVKMSDILIASTKNGGTYGGNWWTDEMREKAITMKRDMETAFWFNNDHSQFIQSGVLRTKTAGLIWTIENWGGFKHNYGVTCDKSAFNYFLSLSQRGSKKKTLFVGNDLMADIESIIDNKYYNVKSVSRYGPIEGDDVINILEYRTANVIVDIIRNPMFEEKYSKYGVMIDDGFLYGCHYANDNKGSRKWRIEQGVQANGAPREEAKYLAHVGIGLACGPNHGLLVP